MDSVIPSGKVIVKSVRKQNYKNQTLHGLVNILEHCTVKMGCLK